MAGCVSPHGVYIADVSPARWQEGIAISVPNSDTLSARDLFIVIRSNEAFRDDTLTLRVAVFAPDSLHYEEPFTLRIPRPPKAAALSRDSEIPYRHRVILADTGEYRFTLTPSRPIRGIEAAGLLITEHNH